jgi:hypothetical protein
MQPVPQGFHHQTSPRIRNRTRRDKLVETNGLLPDYRNGADEADESPGVLQLHWCAREWSVAERGDEFRQISRDLQHSDIDAVRCVCQRS